MHLITLNSRMQILLPFSTPRRNAAPYSYAAYCLMILFLRYNSLYLCIFELSIDSIKHLRGTPDWIVRSGVQDS